MSSDTNPDETPAESTGAQSGFTPGEMELAVACFSTLVSKPELDWDKLAVNLKMKDAKSAVRRFNKFYAKHGPAAQQSTSSSPDTPKRADNGSGKAERGSGRAGKGPGNDGGPVPDAATKVVKKRAPRKPKVKVEKKEEDENEK